MAQDKIRMAEAALPPPARRSCRHLFQRPEIRDEAQAAAEYRWEGLCEGEDNEKYLTG